MTDLSVFSKIDLRAKLQEIYEVAPIITDATDGHGKIQFSPVPSVNFVVYGSSPTAAENVVIAKYDAATDTTTLNWPEIERAAKAQNKTTAIAKLLLAARTHGVTQ